MPGRLYRMYLILRKIAMVGPTEEERKRMEREDRIAARVLIPGHNRGDRFGYIYYGFTAYGERLEGDKLEDN